MSKKRSTRSRSSRQSKRPLRTTPQPPVAEEVVEETAGEPTSLPQEHQVPEEQADFFARMEEELASPSDEADPVDEKADEEVVSEEEVTEENPPAATAVAVSSDEEADETINEVPVSLAKTDEVKEEPELSTEEMPPRQDEEEVLVEEEVEDVDDDRLPQTDFEEDDEEFLSSDKIVHQEKNLAIVQQMENVVSWEIANFYKDNGKVPNKLVMRGSPPLFKITSSKGDSAEFMITRDLAKTLEEAFGDVRKAYYGIDPTIKKNTFGQKNFKEKTNAAVDWFKDNPIKGAFAVIIIIFFLLSPFLY